MVVHPRKLTMIGRGICQIIVYDGMGETMGLFDGALSLRNCPVFHSAGAVKLTGKLGNCRELLSESAQPNRPSDRHVFANYL